MVTYQVPGDAQLTQVIGGSEINDQIFHFHRHSNLGILWARLADDQSLFTLPAHNPVSICSRIPGKCLGVPTGFGDIFMFPAISQYPEFMAEVEMDFDIHKQTFNNNEKVVNQSLNTHKPIATNCFQIKKPLIFIFTIE
jgi:hypothetical protein